MANYNYNYYRLSKTVTIITTFSQLQLQLQLQEGKSSLNSIKTSVVYQICVAGMNISKTYNILMNVISFMWLSHILLFIYFLMGTVPYVNLDDMLLCALLMKKKLKNFVLIHTCNNFKST